jgi:formylglycine-generating enzyme
MQTRRRKELYSVALMRTGSISGLTLGPRGGPWLLAFGALLGALWVFTGGACKKEIPPASAPADPKSAAVASAGSPSSAPKTSAAPQGSAPPGMVWIPPGTFWMGSEEEVTPDTTPVHEVGLDGFWLDKTEVTNEAFAAFVEASGYVTIAEKAPRPEDFPGVPKDKLVAGSVCFHPPEEDVALDDYQAWWRYAKGASWRHPEGPGSSTEGRARHPVVHVAWDDAVAYCEWAQKRLPTEAEWEYAARGGTQPRDQRTRFVWGDSPKLDGRWMANVWQGKFPTVNTKEDGYERSAPVGSFPPNKLGLHDMAGNVWEWVADWYRPDYYARSAKHNPQGPTDSFDPHEPGVPKRVQRGGSFLCSERYCFRYTPGARGKGAPDSGANHVGFRCAKSG